MENEEKQGQYLSLSTRSNDRVFSLSIESRSPCNRNRDSDTGSLQPHVQQPNAVRAPRHHIPRCEPRPPHASAARAVKKERQQEGGEGKGCNQVCLRRAGGEVVEKGPPAGTSGTHAPSAVSCPRNREMLKSHSDRHIEERNNKKGAILVVRSVGCGVWGGQSGKGYVTEGDGK